MLSCNIRFPAPSFWMDGGLESRCVGRVYGADGAVVRHHPHRKLLFHVVNCFLIGQLNLWVCLFKFAFSFMVGSV